MSEEEVNIINIIFPAVAYLIALLLAMVLHHFMPEKNENTMVCSHLFGLKCNHVPIFDFDFFAILY